ncbi:timeless protein-domain-containing protein [Phlyctochytrium arcticum]|nr:timeless protein-domain-containing protein [Phlyctochytrium arcticum]
MEEDEEDTRADRLLSICAACGGYEKIVGENGEIINTYVMGDEVLACLRDLKRMLRRDEARFSGRVVQRLLGQWKILQSDLIPILLQAHQKGLDKIVQAVVQIIVPLTWPINPDSDDAVEQLDIYRTYKEACLEEGVLEAFMKQLLLPLSKPQIERTDRENGFIGLTLTLFRNLAAIKDVQATLRSTTEQHLKSSLQERLVVRLRDADVLQFLIALTGSMDQGDLVEWNIIAMDIFYHLFLDRDPTSIIATDFGRSKVLRELLEKEEMINRQTLKRPVSRHSKFGGTLSFKMMDGQSFTVHNPAMAIKSLEKTFDTGKKAGPIRKPKQSKEEKQFPRSVMEPEAQKAYQKLAQDFLLNGFNGLVLSIRRDIDAERSKVQEGHFGQFLWLVTFFLKAHLAMLKKIQADGCLSDVAHFDTVTSFVNLRGLQFVFKRIRMSEEDKKWGELFLALDCLRQLLLEIQAMRFSSNDEVKDAAENLQRNMYYEHALMETLAQLVKKYKTKQGQTNYLKVLIQVVHIILSMLEPLGTGEDPLVVYSRRKKKKRSRKIADDLDRSEGESSDEYIEEEHRYEDIAWPFIHEHTITTYCLLLRQYRELEEQDIYHLTVMFHRIFVKFKKGPLFYRLSVMELFNCIVTDRRLLPKTRPHLELLAFIRHVTGKFVKASTKNPSLLVELLFPKTSVDCARIDGSATVMSTSKAKKSQPARDLEFKKGMPDAEALEIAVELLKEKKEEYLVELIRASMETILAERLRAASEDTSGDNPPPVSQALQSNSSEERDSMKTNPRLRLLLRTLQFTEAPEAVWEIPGDMSTASIQLKIEQLGTFLSKDSSLSEPTKMVRRKRKARKSRGTRGERAQGAAREQITAKSAAWIEDSDDDADDEEFFRREAEQRARNAEKHGASTTTIGKVVDGSAAPTSTAPSPSAAGTAENVDPPGTTTPEGAAIPVSSDGDSQSSNSDSDSDDSRMSSSDDEPMNEDPGVIPTELLSSTQEINNDIERVLKTEIDKERTQEHNNDKENMLSIHALFAEGDDSDEDHPDPVGNAELLYRHKRRRVIEDESDSDI